MVPPIDSDTERQHREGVSERLSSTPLFHDTSSDSFPTDGHQISNRERRPMVLDSDALRQVPGHGGVPPAHLPGGTLDQTSRSAGRATNDDHRSGAAMSLLGQSVERAIPGTPTPTHVSLGHRGVRMHVFAGTAVRGERASWAAIATPARPRWPGGQKGPVGQVSGSRKSLRVTGGRDGQPIRLRRWPRP